MKHLIKSPQREREKKGGKNIIKVFYWFYSLERCAGEAALLLFIIYTHSHIRWIENKMKFK